MPPRYFPCSHHPSGAGRVPFTPRGARAARAPCGTSCASARPCPCSSQFITHSLPKRPSRIVIISDTIVWGLHGATLSGALTAAGLEFGVYTLPPGEDAKCRACKARVEDWMVAQGCRRDTLVIAFGGGVVGDLAGFVAATYMRGVPVVQVPTTLLAMVDSSVGGKTAIDIPAGKNLVGAFHQPAAVFIDPVWLGTLPPRQFANGMAEVIKTAIIADSDLFALLEASSQRLQDSLAHLASPSHPLAALLTEVVARTAGLKVRVVNQDVAEGGLRAILNFGHTVGHGIEALLAPGMLHGEAVAIGMVKEAEAARELGHTTHDVVARLLALCKAVGLPTAVPAEVTADAIAVGMAVDKKNSGADTDPRCVLLAEVGRVVGPPFATGVDSALLRRLLSPGVSLPLSPTPASLGTPATPVVVRVPGSKSLTNRALLLAGLASGATTLSGVLLSDDTLVMIAALSSMGVQCRWGQGGDGQRTLTVHGTGGRLHYPASGTISVNNAGTAARFLTSALCLLPREEGRSVVLDGNHRMRVRPIGDLVAALGAMTQPGTITYEGEEGFLPLRIRGGGLSGGTVSMRGKVSSQYVSSVLMAGALVGREGPPLTLQLEEDVPTSLPYITMTTRIMQAFGGHTDAEAANRYTVRAQPYTPPGDGSFAIEPDASSATYPAAFAAVTGSHVFLPGLQRATSTQGDVGFLSMLEGMGATVTDVAPSSASEGGVLVSGPDGPLKALGEVDMADATDAFLTMAAVAACAVGETRIVGVANQRVKECNRIAALATEFAKAGIDIAELPDGLVIQGRGGVPAPPRHELQWVGVHAYDDHRVAMSLAILVASRAAPVAGLTIDDAWCVEKTYPTFWRDWTVVLGRPAFGPAEPSSAPAAPAASGGLDAALPLPKHSAVVIIGMRGVGKSTLGRAAAAALGPGWACVDLDDEISSLAGGRTAADIIQTDGWERFRQLEVEALRGAVTASVPVAGALSHRKPASGTVIACGGGVVESPAARALLSSIAVGAGTEAGRVPVVWLRRDPAHIAGELGVPFAASPAAEEIGAGGAGGTAERPHYGEAFGDVYRRREPWFAGASSHTFHILPQAPASGGYDWASVSSAFVQFLTRIGVGACPGGVLCTPPTLHTAPRSKFVCVTAADIPAWVASADAGVLGRVTAGADAVEVRLDKLQALQGFASMSPETKALALQVAMVQVQWLRQQLAPELSIIATVRSSKEGGDFDVEEDAEGVAMLQVLREAARQGVEYVDVETWVPRGVLGGFLQHVQALGCFTLASQHFPTRCPPKAELASALEALQSLGTDVVKLVVMAGKPSDVQVLEECAGAVRADLAAAGRGLITLAMGHAGKLSRVLNPVLTPVTHPELPSAAAPGQLTASRVAALAAELGIVSTQALYIFGSPVAASPSPAMHTALAAWQGAPFTYERCETDTVEGVLRALSQPGTAGGNVTIPLKEAVLPHLAQLSPAAAAIGAVNTLSRLPEQREAPDAKWPFRGDNTDWLGIARPVQAALAALGSSASTSGHALVLGAGGTARAACFAARALGLTPVVWNRTHARAVAVAGDFGGHAVEALEDTAGSQLTSFQLPFTAVLSTLPPGVEVALPSACFVRGDTKAVALVAAYTGSSGLAGEMQAAGCPVVQGLDMIVHQGVAAFSVWSHGRAAPAHIASAAVAAAKPA